LTQYIPDRFADFSTIQNYGFLIIGNFYLYLAQFLLNAPSQKFTIGSIRSGGGQ